MKLPERCAVDGSTSMKQWMQTHCRMTGRDAAAFVTAGGFLDRFPTMAEAATTAVLSKSQVSMIRAQVPKELEPFLEEQQAAVVEPKKKVVTPRKSRSSVDADADADGDAEMVSVKTPVKRSRSSGGATEEHNGEDVDAEKKKAAPKRRSSSGAGAAAAVADSTPTIAKASVTRNGRTGMRGTVDLTVFPA